MGGKDVSKKRHFCRPGRDGDDWILKEKGRFGVGAETSGLVDGHNVTTGFLA